MEYSDYKNKASSEKITLAILEASKRLMGFTLHSDSVYYIPQSVSVISSIRELGTEYTEVESIDDVTTSTFYHDRDNARIYLQTSDGTHPNGKFLTLTFKLFFSSAPVTLPHDIDGDATGFEVYWEPSIDSTSEFGVEIDTINQLGEAIEGKGSLTLYNDFDFWPANFDKLIFENQSCKVFSWNRELSPSQARKIFSGQVERKQWGKTRVTFSLKDLLTNLKDAIPLNELAELENARIADNLLRAKQRMIFGRLFGYRPVNIDEVLDGYPLTGTFTLTNNSDTFTGSGTNFLYELSPDDQLKINGETFTIATVVSDTSLTVTSVYTGSTTSGQPATVNPNVSKRYTNRVWKLAGHELREPVTQTAGGSTVNILFLETTKDIFSGDKVYVGEVGSGELVTINQVLNGQTCTLSTSLASIPPIGTPVLRPCVQDVRIDDVELEFYRDYTVDAENALLTLRDSAEANSSPIKEMTQDITFTSGSRTVTGSGFERNLRPGYMLRVKGNAGFYEILSVESDTSLTLRQAPDYSDTDNGQYRSLVFTTGTNVLSCEILGRTTNGNTDGDLVRTAPGVVKLLLTDAGLSDYINEPSFSEAEDLAPFDVAFAVPKRFEENQGYDYRTIINNINKSVFGTLIQNKDFELIYSVIHPNKPASTTRLRESDILDFTVSTTNANMVKRVVAEYNYKEYDYLQKTDGVSYATQSSLNAEFLLQTDKEKTFTTYLTQHTDATIFASRWAFLLEYSSGKLVIQTKLQGMDLEVNSIIDLEHRKLYERFGGTSNRKIVAVERISKSGSEVTIEAVDLSNALNRVAMINDLTADYIDSNEEQRLYGGFITDQYGMIDNDPDTFGQNVIW